MSSVLAKYFTVKCAFFWFSCHLVLTCLSYSPFLFLLPPSDALCLSPLTAVSGWFLSLFTDERGVEALFGFPLILVRSERVEGFLQGAHEHEVRRSPSGLQPRTFSVRSVFLHLCLTPQSVISFHVLLPLYPSWRQRLQPSAFGLAERLGHRVSMLTAYGVHISANWRT